MLGVREWLWRFWIAGVVVALGSFLAAAQEARQRFDPKRPPERELEMTTRGPFTLAAVGDCITSHPLTPLLATDLDFALVVDILRSADVTFGNFENSAIDFRHFEGFPQRSPGDWALVTSPDVARDLRQMGFTSCRGRTTTPSIGASKACGRRAGTWTKRAWFTLVSARIALKSEPRAISRPRGAELRWFPWPRAFEREPTPSLRPPMPQAGRG